MFFKTFFILFFAGSILTLSVYYFWYKPKFKQSASSFASSIKKSSEEFEELKSKAFAVKRFIAHTEYNSKICFLADMKIASGRKRFFVYDLQKDSILSGGLVAHGSCDNGFQTGANFSNKVNSGCSCLGKFSIGNSYNGKFGLSFKLHGLDSSNSNAYERSIVLHSYGYVPNEEIFPLPICNSRGCPMVSIKFLQRLKLYIKDSPKPILLIIFK